MTAIIPYRTQNFRLSKLLGYLLFGRDITITKHFYKFYTLRSLPQFLISVILACPESFLRSRTSRKDSRQAGMTLKTNIQFQTPCGLCRRVLHYLFLSASKKSVDFTFFSRSAKQINLTDLFY